MANIKLPTAAIEKYSKIEDLNEYRRALFAQIDIDVIDLPTNRVLCAVYITYERTAGGIYKAVDTMAEDIWQGKPAMVLKLGPTAFMTGGEWNFEDFQIKPGDWITSKIGNTSQIELNHYPCRIVTDNYIETRVRDPRLVTS